MVVVIEGGQGNARELSPVLKSGTAAFLRLQIQPCAGPTGGKKSSITGTSCLSGPDPHVKQSAVLV